MTSTPWNLVSWWIRLIPFVLLSCAQLTTWGQSISPQTTNIRLPTICAPNDADYPYFARISNTIGTTKVKFTINEKGKVTGTSILKSAGDSAYHKLLDEVSQKKINTCTFSPALSSDGKPIAGSSTVEFDWKLEDPQKTRCRRNESKHNCFGTITLSNGSEYVGEFWEGKRHGVGTWTAANGDRYTGTWRNDRYHGLGAYTWSSGQQYVGWHELGKFQGTGILYAASGAVLRSGRWVDNNLVQSFALDSEKLPFTAAKLRLSPTQAGGLAVATDQQATAAVDGRSQGHLQLAIAAEEGREQRQELQQLVATTDPIGQGSLIAQTRQREQDAEAARREEQRRQAEQTRLAEERRLETERRQVEERRLAEVQARAEADERERLLLQKRKLEQETEAARHEVTRMREQLARAEQVLESERVSRRTSYRPGRRKALVMGNDSYVRVPRLEAARADARAMAAALSAVGFEVVQHKDLSERGMKQALREFKARVQGGDEVVFFFAGHGVQIGGINYLLPTDIQGESEEQVRDEAIQLQRVLDDMQERSAGFMLAVVDACRDNPFRTTGRAIGGRGLAPTAAATGQMIIFSAGAGQQALDKLNPADTASNGVFTRVFVREMLKPGLPVDRVLRNVRQEVVQLARSVGKEQTPALYDQAVGDFYFKP